MQILPLSAKGIDARYPWVPYAGPFLLFAALTYVLPPLIASPGMAYLIKTAATAAALLFFWPAVRNEFERSGVVIGLLGGVVVFILWVGLEGLYPQIGSSSFDPHQDATKGRAAIYIWVRLAGAVTVVPLIEELFWRSFVLRFLMRPDFRSVPLGSYSWFAFALSTIAFGFEHHRWLPGILAGIVYTSLLVRTRSLFAPTLAHAVTNLLLGLYVIQTERWEFW